MDKSELGYDRLRDDGFDLVHTPDGVDLVVTGDWSSRARDAIFAGRADGLDLNYAKGFRERDLRFIVDLPIKRLDLLARTHSDLDPIYSLAGSLEALHLQTAPTPIDISQFPKLTTLSATWGQVEHSIASGRALTRLFFLSYTPSDLSPLDNNTNLVSLRMKDRPRVRNLDGVEAFPALRDLRLPLAPIEDLEPMRRASPLIERLEFSYCRKFASISALSALPLLARVDMDECGDIDSVEPFRHTPLLELLYMWGSTRILDGDLSPVANLQRLREFRITPRRNYHPSAAEIKTAIGDS